MKLPVCLAICMSQASLAAPAAARERAPTAAQAELYGSAEDAAQPWHRGWADARVAGDLVFVSGVVVAVDRSQAEASVQLAFEKAFEKISSLLGQAGAGLSQVVDITVYMTDVDAQLDAFDNARLKAMQRPYAASTVVQVTRLIPKDGLAEIKVVARIPPPDTHSP